MFQQSFNGVGGFCQSAGDAFERAVDFEVEVVLAADGDLFLGM